MKNVKRGTCSLGNRLVWLLILSITYAICTMPADGKASNPVQAKQICGVHCGLRPDKNEWQTSEIPKFKAYVPAPGSANLWLATIVHQGCQLQVDGQWYGYIDPHWTGGIGVHAKTDWLVQVGGFLSISLDDRHWVTVRESKPLVLQAGKHAVCLGWAGYKEDPTGKASREDNPVLLVSESVQIRILKSKALTEGVTLADERLRHVTELFNSYVQREPITKAEQKLGIKTDLRLFHGWRPEFTWDDIPALLEIAQNDRLIEGMPSLIISSYAGRYCREGMIALWLIEGLRREQALLQGEKQLGEKLQLHIAYSRLPLNPICTREGMAIGECEHSPEIHKAALQAYRTWWKTAGSLPAYQAAAFYPLDLTNLRWFGSPDRWPQEQLKIHERVSSDGTVAERTIRHLRQIEGSFDYEPGRILQTVYYALKNPDVKTPFTPDMLKIQKIVLYYYDKQDQAIRTEDILPLSGQS